MSRNRLPKEGPVIIKPGNGVLFAWMSVGEYKIYMAPIKWIEKTFKVKIKPKEGDMVLEGYDPKYFNGKKWISLVK